MGFIQSRLTLTALRHCGDPAMLLRQPVKRLCAKVVSWVRVRSIFHGHCPWAEALSIMRRIHYAANSDSGHWVHRHVQVCVDAACTARPDGDAHDGPAMPRSVVDTSANVWLAERLIEIFDIFDIYDTECRLRLFWAERV
jgi:hypothetical protein